MTAIGSQFLIRLAKQVYFALALGIALKASVPVQAASPSFECFAVSDLVRVFEDGHGTAPDSRKSLVLFGLQNETVSAQCVTSAMEDLRDLTVSVDPLKQTEGSAIIPGEDIRWDFVGGIFIEKNTPNRLKRDLTRAAPAWFPDYLSEDRHCNIRKGEQKAVYLTVRIPSDAAPGEYRGAVTVTAGTGSNSLPLVLKVYPLKLPEQRHVMATEWFSTSQFRKHHNVNSGDEARFFDMLKVYAENMADHRQNVFKLDLSLVENLRAADSKLRFDFSEFDRWAKVFWDTGHMDLLETGFVATFGEGGWSSTNIVLREFPVKEEATGRRTRMAGAEFLPQFLPALVNHLQEKGWLGKTVFHICDEPSNHNIIAWREASDFVHCYAPELRRIDAIETPHCLGKLEVWVPKLDHLATWQGVYEQAQRQGNELWFYTVGIFQGGSLLNKTVDVPLIESRLIHWLNYRYGLNGYLHWGFNAWTDDPIHAPGEHRGDGWHVYPTPDGLLNSLRWEQMRNGLQDYECLWLLENAIAQIKATLSPRVAALIEPRRRGVEIASRVVGSYEEHTKDPEALYRARREVIEETLGLDQHPRVLLQTNPLENSPVARDCAIDVHGWAEPGTAININGQPVSVASDGLFLAQVSPLTGGRIVVEAQGTTGRRSLARQFREAITSPVPAAKR